MLSFESDYVEGAHEQILQRLIETNLEKLTGYGQDLYCDRAKEKIRKACECPEAEIFFLVGGTQTNTVAVDSLLKSYEGVVAARTGHVSAHEAGAIEYHGHKVLELPEHQGKYAGRSLKSFWRASGRMRTMSIWYFREWFTYPILQNMEPSTARQSFRSLPPSVRAMRFLCIWTGHAWAMAL